MDYQVSKISLTEIEKYVTNALLNMILSRII
ncbi:hypothetical protein Mucpa_3160 [Mucilaginibacter paludis DSM 18603]|uniref:Uncharacterized protein n=1 Tax=Mucilaginibacter paludis DSM 18603 TaxID=714943 RepID=H1YFF6_9SPHI|nr:hypothetical protein Mucpa_3160 [Mucilaginibacter paludis DSM 18603]